MVKVRKFQAFLESSSNAEDEGLLFERDAKRCRALSTVMEVDSSISFHDFRTDTILKYPNFSFLGPASMAVYWFKTYLKTDFGWVHHESPTRQDRRKKSYFCHIPGQYLSHDTSNNGDHDDCPTKESLIRQVLERGTPGVHYAPSYVGIYNMIRMYGKFGINEQGDILLVDYVGPPLPTKKTKEN